MGRPKKEAPNRKDGLYEVKVTVGKDFNGKLIRKSFYSSISKADAKAHAEEYKMKQAVYEATDSSQSLRSQRLKHGLSNGWRLTRRGQ